MRVPATAAAFFFENGQQHVAAMHLRQKRAGGKFQPIVASGIDNSGIHLRQRQDKSVFGNFSFYSYKKACGQKKTVRGSKNSRRLSNGTPAI